MKEEEFPKAYIPQHIEKRWYSFWKKEGFFSADPHSSKPPYCISIPPPNVTGVLHMGHALVDTLQDVLIRWKRMSGFEALWVPGTDHAGIATQTVVERHLISTLGKRRKDFSREEFLSHVWNWKEESEKRILEQIEQLGCSCDWSRLSFTMDEKRSRAVRKAFKNLFDAKLIYRGDYLVNWDPLTQTALADDELEHEEKDSYLWYFRFSIHGENESITVATTRPETTLGDTAIAVAINDERYKKFVGKQAVHPLTNRLLTIIADRRIDPNFGTGAVKITPAHDHLDYEIALEHNLELINIMTPDGKINDLGGEFAGLTMEEARAAVVKAMGSLGALDKLEPHRHRVKLSYRSKAVIEPYLSKQWFIRMSGFKQRLRALVEEKKVRLIPPHWESTYFHWIDNLRDWCISRQLWWGHQIPIWYKKNDPETVLCHDGESLPEEVLKTPEEWIQDPDVLDTWFSSSLWPFAVLGWPEKTPDLKKFYPNSTLITGHDILFFWVARMVMMGDHFLGSSPFPETFLHGLIYGKSYWRSEKDGSISYVSSQEKKDYDLGQVVPPNVQSKWEKMSKSKGNIIDPLELIETYGTDAVRFGLCASATQARQIDLDRRRFEEFKNFVNKLWNGSRFVFLNIETLDKEALRKGLSLESLSLEDRWILSLLNRAIKEFTQALTEYTFDRAATIGYEFFWNQFCAYYIELVKPILLGKSGTAEQRSIKQQILCIVLSNVVRLIHPIAPFITEELFQKLKEKYSSCEPSNDIDPYTREVLASLQSPACIVSPYPKVLAEEEVDTKVEEMFASLDLVVRAIRNIRSEMQLPPHVAIDVWIYAPSSDSTRQLVENHPEFLRALIRIESLNFSETEHSIPFSANAIVGTLKVVIPLPAELKEKEKIRLTKEKDKQIAQQNHLREQLANPLFLAKAPKPLIEKLTQNLDQAEKVLQETIVKLEEMNRSNKIDRA